MAQTTLLSSITRSASYPVDVQGIEASSNCGTLQLILGSDWTLQMIHELPAINIGIYTSDDAKYLDFDIDMSTVNSEYRNKERSLEPIDPYAIAIYDIPESFTFRVTPLFDKYALEAHNDMIDAGEIQIFDTTDKGIVDSNDDNYDSQKWLTPTDTFDITIVFDDSNVSSSGSGGGGSSVTVDTSVDSNSTNPVQNKAIYDFVTGKLSSSDARFINTFNSVSEMEAYSGEVANNDYAYVKETTSSGITYNKYKWSSIDNSWHFEYQLNTSPFTAEQLATINSGLTASDKTNYNNGLTELNSLKTNVGNLSSLETETKTNIVSSINELLDAIKELQTLSIEVKEISQ